MAHSPLQCVSCGKRVGEHDAILARAKKGELERLPICRTHGKATARLLRNTGRAEAVWVPLHFYDPLCHRPAA